MIENLFVHIRSNPLIRDFVHTIAGTLGSLFFRLFWIFPIKKNKFFVIHFNGKGYSDNPKYLCEEILSRNVDADIVWMVYLDEHKPETFPSSVRFVSKYSLRTLYELATSSVWINDVRMDDYVRKRKGQKYIQTWHGGFAMKKVEADVPDSPKWYVRASKNDSKMADIFVSGSEIQSKVYRSAFRYSGRILEAGYPRNDLLVVPDRLSSTKDTVYSTLLHDLRLPENKKILLYAPTFRKDLLYSDSNPEFIKWQDSSSKRFGDEWIVLLRLHPNIIKTIDTSSRCDNIRVFDVSSYPDMQELLAVADVLVTDYSSCMFDFGLTKRPCFLYAPDVETYASDDRGFYIQLSELPFPLYKSNEELMSGIESFDSEEYQNNLSAFYEKYGSFEKGDASKKVVDWILSQMS